MPGPSTAAPSSRVASASSRAPRVSLPRARRRDTPRILPLRPAVARRLAPLIIDPAAVESVRRSGLTEAELRSVKAPTLKAYGECDARFHAWCRTHRRLGKWVNALLAFVTFLMSSGAATSEVEKTVSAVMFFKSASMKQYPRVVRALRGQRHVRPHRSRVPLAEEVVSAVAAILVPWGLRPLALLVLTAMTAYLRPGEVMSLRAEDILPPSQGRAALLREWSVFLRPEERGEPTKTGTFDETIYLDHPPGLGPALGAYKNQYTPSMTLFPFQPSLVATVWRAAVEAAGAPGSVLYQLRHAGASGDLLALRRSMLVIQSRGRWKSSTNCRRYSKSGQVQRPLAKLSAGQMALGIASLKNLEGLLLGTWFPPSRLVPPPPRRVVRCQQAMNECIMKARSIGVAGRRRRPLEASCTRGSKRARL